MLYCVYVVLVHNYSSGNPEPPREDSRLTKGIVEAGEIMGVAVLDRAIVCDKKDTQA